MLSNLIDRIKLPFRKEKELYSSLYRILGFYPRDIRYYKLALMHKSVMRRGANGKPANNERLEFLGDAILDAIVGDIVYRHFPGKREGFLTNTRSKLVQRETLNKLAQEMGISRLILSSGRSSSHNNYMGGNAFEALVGAIYLDRGYTRCMKFMEQRILAKMINIDKVAYKEVNFKSKLIEWSQKNRVKLDFKVKEQGKDKNGSPFFLFCAVLEGVEGCVGKGYSKKESQQLASKLTLERLKKEPSFIDEVFAAKTQRTKMEEEPVSSVPDTEPQNDFIIVSEQTIVAETPQETAVVEAPAELPKENAEPALSEKQTERKPRTRRKPAESTDSESTVATKEEKPMAADTPASVTRRRKAETEKPTASPKKKERTATEKADDAVEGAATTPRRRKKPAAKEESHVGQESENAPQEPRMEIEKPQKVSAKEEDPDFDLSHITAKEQSREDIIAAAEAAAFSE